MDLKLKTKLEIIKCALSPFDFYCSGFNNMGANPIGYLTAVILSVGKTKNLNKNYPVPTKILAFDRAEIETAYLGQINMITVSSFCGPNGMIWGYDLVAPRDLKLHHPLLPNFFSNGAEKIPIFRMDGLLRASQAIFGSADKRHFPFLPGSHVNCAFKKITKAGPAHIYSALAIGIASQRSSEANLFMEDYGEIHIKKSINLEIIEILENLINSVVVVGKNQKVKYSKIFVGFKDIKIAKGETGCALSMIPYFTLAKKAIPNGDSYRFCRMDFASWQKEVKNNFLFHKNNESIF